MSRYAAVVLAAGRGSRFRASGGGGPSKLVAELDGVPLVRRVAGAASGSHADPVIVVTGHASEAVRAALDGLDVTIVHNPHFVTGLASSLQAGISALPADVAGTLVLLGDMPMISADLLRRLISEADAHPDADAVVPVAAGRRGNPVLLSRRLFAAVAGLAGDAGARHLLGDPALSVRHIMVDGFAVTVDVDEIGDLEKLAAPPDPRTKA